MTTVPFSSNTLLVDTFLYNGEPIVELRLKHMNPFIDQFFITESRYTFSGKKKHQLYITRDAHIFEPYKDKITFLIIDEFPVSCSDAWKKEGYQRNYCRDTIIKYSQTKQLRYVVLCCDVDELPTAHLLFNLRGWYDHLLRPAHLNMEFYYYNFDWKVPTKWALQFVVNGQGFESEGFDINHVRQILSHPSANLDKYCLIPNAGWHFSYFSSWEDIRRKLESFSHTEFDYEEYKSKENIVRSIAKGLDLFHRGAHLDLVKATPTEQSLFPTGWKELQSRLLEMQQ